MKRIISLLIAVLMLCALCVPALAEEDAPVEVAPDAAGSISIFDKGNYFISENCTVIMLSISPLDGNATLTIPPNVTVTLTDNLDCSKEGTINVLGTLIGDKDGKRQFNQHGTIHVGCAGTLIGLNEGTIIRDEHAFDDNGICTSCGFVDVTKHKHDFSNGNCACGEPCPHKAEHATVVVSAEKEYCLNCGGTVSMTEISATVSGDTASILSEGNMTVVLCVACLAVGLVGGLLLGKKKKTAPAGGEED